jgi:hypothetical protein
MRLHREHKLSIPALLLAALTASPGALSQPFFDPASSDAALEIAEQMERIEARDGPRSPELIALLQALGMLYQESGDDALAVAAIERAWALVRMNYGLQTLDQVPLIRQRIEIARERGEYVDAWNLEQALLVLARRHPDDARTISILQEMGDARMAVLERYVAGEFPPEIVLGCYYDQWQDHPMRRAANHSSCSSGFRDVVIRSVLWEAQMHYSDAIKVAIADDRYTSDEVRELEMKLVRSHFLYGAMYLDGRDYALGRESLRRLVAYEAAASAPPLVQMEALISVADWDLLFAQSGNLRETAHYMYEHAYRRLRETGQHEAAIEAIFSPEMPVVLPAFLPNPLDSNDGRPAADYLDIAFEVTTAGRARKLEILAASTASKRAAVRHVSQLIERSRFRPRLVDGEFADSPPIVVRYYLPESFAGLEEQ